MKEKNCKDCIGYELELWREHYLPPHKCYVYNNYPKPAKDAIMCPCFYPVKEFKGNTPKR